MTMKSVLIWDLPTRLLHWGLAASVAAALGIALGVEKESPLFAWHMLAGLAAVCFAVLRIVWGVVGTRHARFVNFPLSPRELASYLAAVLRGRTTHFAGVNPAAAWAGVAMLAAVGLLAVTGIAGGGETFEEAHEVIAYGLLGVIVAHLVGLAWHAARQRDGVPSSMLTGRKQADATDEISSARPIWGVALLVGAVAWVGALFNNYDRTAGTVRVPVVGATVRLGENENGERGREGHGERGGHERGERGHEGRHGGHDDD